MMMIIIFFIISPAPLIITTTGDLDTTCQVVTSLQIEEHFPTVKTAQTN